MRLPNNHIKRFLSVFLVFSILNVYATEFICNISHNEEQQSEQHHHDATEENHHHDESSDGNHDTEHHEDNCCNASTSCFYSSLNIPSVFHVPSKAIVSFEIIFPFISSIEQNISSTLYVLEFESPPPKIPDIRIFTASFLI